MEKKGERGMKRLESRKAKGRSVVFCFKFQLDWYVLSPLHGEKPPKYLYFVEILKFSNWGFLCAHPFWPIKTKLGT